jgi:hypothetical protein
MPSFKFLSQKPIVLVAALLGTLVAGSAFAADDDIPRTPWGKPDLNGYWDYHHLTPLQRPARFEGIAVLDEAAAKDWEDNAYNREADRRGRNSTREGVNYVGVDLWHEEALGDWELDEHRTALITEPANGRLPPMLESRRKERAATPRYRGFPRGPEDRSMAERCISAFQSVPPIQTLIENAMLQILLTEEYVVIHTERMHDSRIVPLDNRPPLPGHVKQFYGSSSGYWDGDTLVIETTNIHESYSYQGSSPDMKVIERLTRTNDGRIHYEYTIDDPRTWEQPWTASYHWKKDAGPIFEYACHEWNYGMTGILRGARVEEADAAAGPSEDNYR